MTTFGERVRDLVTGFEGVVIARAEYAYSVPQLLIVAETKQAAVDSRWLEESRVVQADDHEAGFSRTKRDSQ